MSDMETEILSHDFYTMERWNNWITQVKESGFEFKESEEPQDKDSAVFINMEDDIILACLKVVAKFEKNLISAESAFHLIAQIKDIALAEIEPISDDIDMMIASMQTSLIGTFAAFECYIRQDFNKKARIPTLLKQALEAEAADSIEISLDKIAEIGALIINGRKLPDEVMEDIPYGLVAEWMDGIDSIAAAMMGSDSYKNDEADDES
ncbi:MAG: DUF2150 family protein [Methanomethylovorans sp.]|jgi:hypothetical protein|uniref:DUF2150 family protein n=1 Tax=Methanomethylovorans sp. TaxID=2758717 RepID=UPI00353153E0